MPRKGFTLLELVVVVVIIGLLVTMAMPNFRRMVERGKYAQALHFLGPVRAAWLRYYDTYLQTKPTAWSDFDVDFTQGAAVPTNPNWAYYFDDGTSTTTPINAIVTAQRLPPFPFGRPYNIGIAKNGDIVQTKDSPFFQYP